MLAGAALGVVTAAPSSAQSVKAGIEAWQRGAPAEAVEIWRPLARSGDADAAFNLGQAYRLGRGTAINLAAAQTWFERAARDGHVDAQTTLGLLLFDTGNRIGGLRWLRSAAEQGEPRALLVYGTALINGDGVTQDRALGYAFVHAAAAAARLLAGPLRDRAVPRERVCVARRSVTRTHPHERDEIDLALCDPLIVDRRDRDADRAQLGADLGLSHAFVKRRKVTLGLKADHVVARQVMEQLCVRGQYTQHFDVRKRNVQKESDGCADITRPKMTPERKQVIVMNPNQITWPDNLGKFVGKMLVNS